MGPHVVLKPPPNQQLDLPDHYQRLDRPNPSLVRRSPPLWEEAIDSWPLINQPLAALKAVVTRPVIGTELLAAINQAGCLRCRAIAADRVSAEAEILEAGVAASAEEAAAEVVASGEAVAGVEDVEAVAEVDVDNSG